MVAVMDRPLLSGRFSMAVLFVLDRTGWLVLAVKVVVCKIGRYCQEGFFGRTG
jgi:hypothetical protein